jgi:phage baseplate assembly protein V
VAIDGGESALVPWLTTRAGPDVTWWAPAAGEQVMLFSPDGEPSNGVILAGVYSGRYPAPRDDPKLHAIVYRDGAAIQYDTEQHRYILELPPDAELVLAAPKIILRADEVEEEPYERELNDGTRPDADTRCGGGGA